MIETKLRLLVIDDDPQVRRMYDRTLQHAFAVETVADGTGALQRLACSPRFDVVLCDWQLAPGMSGQDVFEALCPELQARVVMCSGAEPEDDDGFRARLGDRFVLKLGPIAALVSLLRRVARSLPRAAA